MRRNPHDFVATHFPALIVIIPLLMSVVVALLPSAGLAWLLTLAAVTASFATALFNMDQIAAGAVSYHLGGWPPPWGIEFIADGASMLVATVVTGLSFASTLYAKALIEKRNTRRCHSSFLCGMAARYRWVARSGDDR